MLESNNELGYVFYIGYCLYFLVVMGMLEWSNEDCRALLTVYPGALRYHLSVADHPPQEELWVQLAKDLISSYNFCKEPFQV